MTVHSDPVTLPSAVANADGVASSTWSVPADFETGDHTVTFASSDGELEYSAAFAVIAADDAGSGDDTGATGGSGDAGDADRSGDAGATADGSDDASAAAAGAADGDADALAVTGAEAPMGLLLAAGVLTLLGAAVLVAGRRTTASSTR